MLLALVSAVVLPIIIGYAYADKDYLPPVHLR